MMGASRSFVVAIEARQLDRRFVGLATGVAQEHFLHAGDFAQFIGDQLLLANLVQVRGMDQFADLCG